MPLQLDTLFWLVATATMTLGATSALVGTTLFLSRRSQMADTVGHAAFPGVMIAFIIFQTRTTWVLVIGAVIISSILLAILRYIRDYNLFEEESVMALSLASFFSLGILLYQLVQRFPAFSHLTYAGLDRFIFGQAALLKQSDLFLILSSCLVIVILFIILYPLIQRYLFDPVHSKLQGIKVNYIDFFLNLAILWIISLGLQAVGTLLIASLLITPSIIVSPWINTYGKMLIFSVIVGVITSFMGTLISTQFAGISTGPAIILNLSLLALVSQVAFAFTKKAR